MEIMTTMKKLWVFVVMDKGVEKIATYPDRKGKATPLVYFSEQGIKDDNMKEAIQVLAIQHKVHFELREYVLQGTLESFDPIVAPLTM